MKKPSTITKSKYFWFKLNIYEDTAQIYYYNHLYLDPIKNIET